jgi:hypothetical protein
MTHTIRRDFMACAENPQVSPMQRAGKHQALEGTGHSQVVNSLEESRMHTLDTVSGQRLSDECWGDWSIQGVELSGG